MSKSFKDFVDPLSHEIINLTFEFLHEILEKKISDEEIMNLVVSAHMTSLFCSMRIIASHVPEFKNNVEKVIKNISKSLNFLTEKEYTH